MFESLIEGAQQFAAPHLDRPRWIKLHSTRSRFDGGDSHAARSCGPRADSEAHRRGQSEFGVSGLHLSVQQTNRPHSGSLPSRLSLVPTILHISDLHRTAGPQLSNDELLPALVSDAIRWRAEGIPKPDLIVVSGDLVQGAALDAPDPDAEVDTQYREVGDFLEELSEEFLDGNRSRMVIVPGNHDVHWRRSLDGMTPIDPCPDGIATKATTADFRFTMALGRPPRL